MCGFSLFPCWTKWQQKEQAERRKSEGWVCGWSLPETRELLAPEWVQGSGCGAPEPGLGPQLCLLLAAGEGLKKKTTLGASVSSSLI